MDMAKGFGVANCYRQFSSGSGLLVTTAQLWSPSRQFPGCWGSLYPYCDVNAWLECCLPTFTHVVLLATEAVKLPSVPPIKPIGYWSDSELGAGLRFSDPTKLAEWSLGQAS